MQEFLAPSKYIDSQHESILQQAKLLREGSADEVAVVKRCFEYVRDDIKHSYDFKLNPVTCRASDVLREKTGFCFAKSHLLAALLRANNIPAALLYQRVSAGEGSNLFFWHGLNSVYLSDYGWYRLDPRGIKPSYVVGSKEGWADCTPPLEAIPFLPKYEGEVLLEKRWSEPSAKIVKLLESCETYDEVINDLLKIETIVD